MAIKEIRIGTRGSRLALCQSGWVKERLAGANPDLPVRLVQIRTSGDRIQDVPLARIGGKGLFVKEIEEALIARQVDLAVHSIKDVPTELAGGLLLSSITQREDPRDVFISRDGTGLQDLKKGARVGTSSLRRQAQLKHFRKDLELVSLRGNLDTRLRKLESTDLDAIVLARAGVKRMGLEGRITEVIPLEISLPAVGQGALGIETRLADEEVQERTRILHDRESFIAVSAERAFLKRLGGGCQVPIAGLARVEGALLRIDGLVGTADGERLIRHSLKGPVEKAEPLGVELAEILLDRGAGEILKEIYQTSAPTVWI